MLLSILHYRKAIIIQIQYLTKSKNVGLRKINGRRENKIIDKIDC